MSDESRRRRWFEAAIVAGIVIVSVALRPPRNVFFDNDEGVYAAAAMMVLDGKTLCKETWGDRPGIVAIYALTMAIFGYSLTAIHSVAIVFVLLTQLFLFKIVSRLFDKYSGYAAALCYGIFSTTYQSEHVLAANCELFMVLPATISIYWVLKSCQERKIWGFFLVGVFGALAALIKQVAILDTAGGCLFVAIPVVVGYAKAHLPGLRRGRRPAGQPPPEQTLRWLLLAAALVVAGLAVVLGPVFLYFWLEGALPDLKEQVWGWYRDYRGVIRPSLMLLAFRLNTGTLITDNWLLWSLALAGAVGVVVAPADRERDGQASRLPRLLLVCWAGFALLGVCAGRRFWAHYYVQAFPPFAALAGAALWAAVRDWSGGRWRQRKNLAVGALLLFGTVMPVTKYHGLGKTWLRRWLDLDLKKGYLEHWHECEAERKAGEYLRQHTPETAKIFVWGFDAWVYFYAQRQPASRFVACTKLIGFMPCGALDELVPRRDATLQWKLWQEDMDKNRPEIIVDASASGLGYSFDRFPTTAFGPIRRLLEDEYEMVETIPCTRDARLTARDERGALIIYARRSDDDARPRRELDTPTEPGR